MGLFCVVNLFYPTNFFVIRVPAVAADPAKERSIENVSIGRPVRALTGTACGAVIVALATCGATPSTKVVSTAVVRMPSPLIVATFCKRYPFGASDPTLTLTENVTSEFAEISWWSHVIVRADSLVEALGLVDNGIK